MTARKHLTRAQIEAIVRRNAERYEIDDSRSLCAMFGALADMCVAMSSDTEALDPELAALMRSHVL